MKIHELKTWPPYYDYIANGVKTFELRVNDRGYKEGDILHLREWIPQSKRYTGKECYVRVGVSIQGEWGLNEDTICMSIKLIDPPQEHL